MTDKKIEEIIDDNLSVALEQGPRLSTRYSAYVTARSPTTGQILLGGLGCLGCGSMWVTEQPYHMDYPGYVDAKIVYYPGDFLR